MNEVFTVFFWCVQSERYVANEGKNKMQFAAYRKRRLIWFSLNESKITKLEPVDFIYHLQVNPTIPKCKRSKDLRSNYKSNSHSRANYESNPHFRAKWEREAIGHGYFRGIVCFEILVKSGRGRKKLVC
ncbi:hypothetical protein DVH24_010927 [Malus domestica]|uniref:Uncharacterized protein n=1 Tax=Malus domestica TaxID=3750 RepID=A0A498JYP7_MALDO|nr:hypothetical protein DVH24_010927 [Malus domestica]